MGALMPFVDIGAHQFWLVLNAAWSRRTSWLGAGRASGRASLIPRGGTGFGIRCNDKYSGDQTIGVYPTRKRHSTSFAAAPLASRGLQKGGRASPRPVSLPESIFEGWRRGSMCHVAAAIPRLRSLAAMPGINVEGVNDEEIAQPGERGASHRSKTLTVCHLAARLSFTMEWWP
ncbi:hypothetical protein CC78DRAFT_585592 [Lojkania enalia]|uniref:Uncharacterized protein n=1 Tax=Lojkania enalia TaxID=147567 RepID=A0A9P4N5Q9_9PLEO|nr:hypothetical protein CC78DRAFT_585592 [Didymosphaeria enalia]